MALTETPTRRLARFRTYFLTGLIVTGPLAITLYLVWVFVQWADGWIVPLVPRVYRPDTYLPFHVPGFGIAVGIFVVTMVGFLTANFVGRGVVVVGESVLARMPVVRTVYRATKQLIETILSHQGGVFQKSALVRYPGRGGWVLAVVAPQSPAEVHERLSKEADGLYSLFVPNAPNPATGFMQYVPADEALILKATVEETLKTVISVGLVARDSEAESRTTSRAKDTVLRRKKGARPKRHKAVRKTLPRS